MITESLTSPDPPPLLTAPGHLPASAQDSEQTPNSPALVLRFAHEHQERAFRPKVQHPSPVSSPGDTLNAIVPASLGTSPQRLTNQDQNVKSPLGGGVLGTWTPKHPRKWAAQPLRSCVEDKLCRGCASKTVRPVLSPFCAQLPETCHSLCFSFSLKDPPLLCLSHHHPTPIPPHIHTYTGLEIHGGKGFLGALSKPPSHSLLHLPHHYHSPSNPLLHSEFLTYRNVAKH